MVKHNFLSDLSPDGIVVIDVNGNVDYVNAAFSNITGYTLEEVVGLDQRAFNALMGAICEAYTVDVSFECGDMLRPVLLKQSRPVQRHLSCIYREIEDTKGIKQGKVLYFHDITLDQDNVDSLRGDYLSVAGHKLRTPLVGILGFSELLSKRNFDEERQQEIIATIYRQSNAFKQMFDNFLMIERLDISKTTDFNCEIATLERVVEESIADINGERVQENIEISFEAPDHWPLVNFDFDKTKRVISNLLDNAINYSPGHCRVALSTVSDSNKGVEEFGLRVSDSGIGISPANLEKLGERFYRVEELQSVSGSGLGLAIVKAIMAIQHGRFELISTKGKGCTAVIWFKAIA